MSFEYLGYLGIAHLTGCQIIILKTSIINEENKLIIKDMGLILNRETVV